MPFEEGLSAEMLRQIERFQVRPFGQIRQSCEHIPYNSSKKDFFGKTGRESIDGKSTWENISVELPLTTY